jgi:magnesium chelatase family protein
VANQADFRHPSAPYRCAPPIAGRTTLRRKDLSAMTEPIGSQQAVQVPAVARTGATTQMVAIQAVPAAGQPSTTIAGLPDEHARTTHDRIHAAIVFAGLAWPQQPVALSVFPHALPAGDCGLDLTFALAVLAASGQIPTGRLAATAYLGELGLDGGLRSLSDVAARLQVVNRTGLSDAVVPAGNLTEAALAAHGGVHAARTLSGLVAALRGATPLLSPAAWPTAPLRPDADLADLPAEHWQARRILEIAAAGGHHLLMVGHATGAVLLAERLPGLLPDLDATIAAEVAQAHRQAGTLPPDAPVRRRPPWQAPHHTTGIPALAGAPRRPGAVALAHAGVLWCARADQLGGAARDVLRLVLDQRRITSTGGGAATTYPARVQLLLATTGCPKPTAGDTCDCPPEVHHRFLGRMSGLFDRVDIHATLPPMPPPTMPSQPGESSAVVAARVATARAAAAARWARQPWRTNSEATSQALQARLARLPASAFTPLRTRIATGALSARAGVRVLRLGFTIADLAGHDRPTAEDLAEAIWLRTGQRVA